jgi:hypothetical protein
MTDSHVYEDNFDAALVVSRHLPAPYLPAPYLPAPYLPAIFLAPSSTFHFMGCPKLLRETFLITLFVLTCAPAWAEDSPMEIAFFEKKIRPVLIKHCYQCHSAEAVKNGEIADGLQLDTRAGIRRGGDSGPGVVPKKPELSLLLATIRHEQDLAMPPDGELPADVISDFARWIEHGAADPRDGKPIAVGIDPKTAREHWALRPIEQPVIPQVRNEAWPRSDLDRFVLAKRESRTLEAVADAPPQVLRRRLFFDLVGLPPTPSEQQQFREASTEEVVDYLLASPHFGERWGRHWLDVARYAESNGQARNRATLGLKV